MITNASSILERVEVTLGDTGKVAVYDVTHDLAQRASAVLREWMRTKDEETMLRQFALLAEELRRASLASAAHAEDLGGDSVRVAAKALRDLVREKCFTADEQKAFVATQRYCWDESRRKDRKIQIALSHAQLTRVAAIFRGLIKTSDFSTFNHGVRALYTEIFGPLHDSSKHRVVFNCGLHALSPVELKRFGRVLRARERTPAAELEAIGMSLRDPCVTCTYIHAACAPPDDARSDECCECPCHMPLLRSAGGDA